MNLPQLVLGLVLTLSAAGCSTGSDDTRILAPAPNLYGTITGDQYPEDAVPDGLRRITSEILYVTDRNPLHGEGGILTGYGNQRSDSMAFGVSLVEYGELESWRELVQRTHEQDAKALTRLDPVYLQELARFPATPLPFERRAGTLVTLPEAAQAYQNRVDVMRSEIAKRLQEHRLDRVQVYIHGFNNAFEDGIGTLANIWHYSGRQSLPIAYSWPAGNEGLFRYFQDVESGEFSVFHVKEFLRVLASIPEVKQIDIVAHSRGNAVVTNALRELLIEARGQGRDPRQVMKTGTLLMAAPDLDVGVVRQRLIAERFLQAFDQINIYVNPNDRALRLSQIVGAVTRLGNVTGDEFSMAEIESLTRAGNVGFIFIKDSRNRLGHSYFRRNPAVLSDIILTLRTGEAPGSVFRPLQPTGGSTWVLHPNYPGPELPDLPERESGRDR